MASLDSARSLMAIAMKHGLPIFHADIPQAFIQAVLAEDIYCNLPSGIEIKSELLDHVQKHHPGSKLALKLLKSLYGLKQAPACFNALVNKVLLDLGFTRCVHDTCMYSKEVNGEWCLVAVFVDDLLVTGTSESIVGALKKMLETEFKTKDEAGNVTYEGQWENVRSYLGMDINNENGVLSMNIAAKIDALFERFPLLKELKPANCIRMASMDETIDESKLTSFQEYLKEHFAEITGTLIYVSITCRPDISCAV